MARFNEPELCLLKDWTDARLLEDSMKEVRNKYDGILEEVIEKVQRNHNDLDCLKRWFLRSGYRAVAIGKSNWPKSPEGWPSGFGIDHMGLDSMVLESDTHPSEYLFINGLQQREVEEKLGAAVRKTLGTNWEPCPEKNGGGFYCRLESRQALLDLLIKDEARGFIACMVGHFKQMAQLMSDVDECVSRKRGRK